MLLGEAEVMRFLLIISIFFMTAPIIAWAQEENQTPKSIEVITKEAKEGSGAAAYTLAQHFIKKQNYAKAEEWLRFAIFKEEGKASLTLYDLAQAKHIELENANKIKEIGLLRLHEEAESGDPSSALLLADMYLKGEYLEKDYQRAQKWFRAADHGGKERATYMLGISYINGLYNNISPRKAMRYFEKASQAGFTMADRQLGIAYATGIGKERDLNKAKSYFENSANNGDTFSMRDLALIHKELGNDEDYLKWLKIASKNGEEDSNYYLGQYYKNIDAELSKKYFDLATQKKHHLSRMQVDEEY